MMTIKLNLTSPGWQEKADGKLKQRGTCWQEPLNLLKVSTDTELKENLQQQNGFYALIWERGEQFYAAVDHIRSIPLFYALNGSDFFLSDDAEWVRYQVGNAVMDEIAKEEFQLAGYVTGQDTLYPDVKQLQAGEFLSIDTKTDTPKIKTERYYRFLHTEPENYDEQALYQRLDAAALSATDILIRHASGRQIVIPLSGGYDSRLIATLLKRRGYENIITFSYGVCGNKESSYSKKVAEELGLEWHFIKYSNELWRDAWKTEERWQYQKWASGWCSIAHVQDWLAVKILKEESIVENDCIFVPGHSGDFVAGSHIPDIAFEEETLSRVDSCQAILSRHYALAPKANFKVDERFWLNRIKDEMEFEDFSSNIDFADGFEKWDWQERQAKFICNSVRVYEFFGYDWWMPLWDMDFVRFWQEVPLELRKGREWYVEYVKSKYFEYSEGKSEKNLNNASDDAGLKAFLKSTFLYENNFLRTNVSKSLKIFRKVRPALSSLAYEAWFDEGFYAHHKDAGYCVNGMLAKEFIFDRRISH